MSTFGYGPTRWTSNATVPTFLTPANRRWHGLKCAVGRQLNFYRIHVLVFVFTPLIAAAIFYASNGDVHIPFIDCLFVCVSAMTVTGLVTYNISTSTPWQQAILFILMLLGNISAVSVTMIWVRRHFFRVKFDHVIKNNATARKKAHDIEEAHHLKRRKGVLRMKQRLGLHKLRRKYDKNGDQVVKRSVSTSSTDRQAEAELKTARAAKRNTEAKKRKHKGPLRTDMIVRMDQPAMLVNPMGMPSEGHPAPMAVDASGSGGGILNTASERRPGNAEGADTLQQPSIRISLPLGESSGSACRRSSLPYTFAAAESLSTVPFTESAAQNLQHTESESDGDFELYRQDDVVEAEGAAAESEQLHVASTSMSPRTRFSQAGPRSARRRRVSDPSTRQNVRQHARRGSESGLSARYGQTSGCTPAAPDWRPGEDRLPRAQTVEFAEPPRSGTRDRGQRAAPSVQGQDRSYTTGYLPRSMSGSTGLPRQRTFERNVTSFSAFRGVPLTRTMTSAKDRGFGGFPTPIELAGKGIRAVMPILRDRIVRSTTMQRRTTIASTHSLPQLGTQQTSGTSAPSKSAPYLSFDVNVYGNSMFHSLTEAQRDELGGVEYRALDLLAKIVPLYWLGCQMIMIVIVAPYLASPAYAKYRPVFKSQGRYEPNTTWFWFFSVTSAYSNTGMSLIDTSMIQMADAYLLLLTMGFLVLIGNTAFPIFLRFWIWVYSKLTPRMSRTYETLRFILDHPRRCFVYLFPSGQTWFLLMIILAFTLMDWFFFLILDIDNPEIESIPLPQRVFDGLFQSIAVRAAGFQVVSLLSLAPAVQFLYVIMMYISAYPIALSVRSTNVYEERSLGVYVEKQGDVDEELLDDPSARSWGTYLAAHARRQLAFDIWWLGFALWLICIIERHDIQDPTSDEWFTVFSCLFELTSAYGTVGLSTGTPTDAFSLSGRFHTLGKLVVIATMLRGRHRGLPVAIDRSILLPQELEDQDAVEEAWSMLDFTSRAGDPVQSFHRTSTTSPMRPGADEGEKDVVEEAMIANQDGLAVGVSFAPCTFATAKSQQAHPAPALSYGHQLSSTMSPRGLDAIQERREYSVFEASGEEHIVRSRDRRDSTTEVEQQSSTTSDSRQSSEPTGNGDKGKAKVMADGERVDRLDPLAIPALGTAEDVEGVRAPLSTTSSGSSDTVPQLSSTLAAPQGDDDDDDARSHPLTAAIYGSATPELLSLQSEDKAERTQGR